MRDKKGQIIISRSFKQNEVTADLKFTINPELLKILVEYTREEKIYLIKKWLMEDPNIITELLSNTLMKYGSGDSEE